MKFSRKLHLLWIASFVFPFSAIADFEKPGIIDEVYKKNEVSISWNESEGVFQVSEPKLSPEIVGKDLDLEKAGMSFHRQLVEKKLQPKTGGSYCLSCSSFFNMDKPTIQTLQTLIQRSEGLHFHYESWERHLIFEKFNKTQETKDVNFYSQYLQPGMYTRLTTEVNEVIFSGITTALDKNLKLASLQQEREKAHQHNRYGFGSGVDKNLAKFQIHSESAPFGHGFEVAKAEVQGHRPTMEDATVAQWYSDENNPLLSKGIQKLGFLGVFDGHGGSLISLLASKTAHHVVLNFLSQLTAEQLKDDEVIRKTLENSFSKEAGYQDVPASAEGLASLDEVLKAKCNALENESEKESCAEFAGSTAVMGVILNDQIYFINLGDSRAIGIYGDSFQPRRLTKDQAFGTADGYGEESEEFDAVTARGGQVWRGRISGCLAVPRALGDWAMVGLGRKPEITKINLADPNLKAVIFHCDGVAEGTSDTETAMSFSSSPADAKKAAEAIVEFALRYSSDNISAVVMRVLH